MACENCDALAAQVVALRQALHEASAEIVRLDPYIQRPEGTGYDCGRVLTDTAEAAARYQREQRLEGAKAIAKLASLQHRENCQSYPGKTDACTPDCPLRVLAEMEREAG